MLNPECGFLYARDRKMLSLNPQNTVRKVILWSDSVFSTFTVISLAVQDHEDFDPLALFLDAFHVKDKSMWHSPSYFSESISQVHRQSPETVLRMH